MATTKKMEPYVIVCKCKKGTMIRRCSNSEKNRNRMYYCCPKSEATNGIWSWGCNHFLWEHKLVPQGWDNGGEAESSASGGKASLDSDEQKYPCPCGQGNLTIKTTQTQGKNHKRKYLTCPASKSGGEDCGFYSFLDELMWCRCGKGYCRNLFKNKNKYWCCPLKDTNDCGFRALVSQPSTGSPPATPIHPSTVTSPTTPKHPAPSHSSTGASPTPTTPCHFDSSTPTRLEEDLSGALALSQKANETLIGIVKDLVKKVSLKDEGQGSQHGTPK